MDRLPASVLSTAQVWCQFTFIAVLQGGYCSPFVYRRGTKWTQDLPSIAQRVRGETGIHTRPCPQSVCSSAHCCGHLPGAESLLGTAKPGEVQWGTRQAVLVTQLQQVDSARKGDEGRPKRQMSKIREVGKYEEGTWDSRWTEDVRYCLASERRGVAMATGAA